MDEEKITLTEKEGAIVLRDAMPPEIYTPVGVGEPCDNVRFTLAFLLYAAEREDWIKEFSAFVDSARDNYSAITAAARRSNFKVIEGEKTSVE